MQLDRPAVVAMEKGETGRSLQHLRPHRGVGSLLGQGEREPSRPLAAIAAFLPEFGQPGCQAEAYLRAVPPFQRPVQCGSQIVVLALQALEHVLPATTGQPNARLVHQGTEVLSVLAPGYLRFPPCLQLLGRILPNCLQHEEARLVLLHPKEILLDERRDLRKQVRLSIRVAHRLRCPEGTAAGKDREPGTEVLLLLGEEAIAPVDGAAEGLLPCRLILGSSGKKPQPVL